ncbi:MAG: hypothetical protein ACRD0S_04475, partial [Acidimicrobiales bacterium]
MDTPEQMDCAQCGQPFVVGATTWSCPHCASAKAARCRECGEPIYLLATTCVRHSDVGRDLFYQDPAPAGDEPAGDVGAWRRADNPPAPPYWA